MRFLFRHPVAWLNTYVLDRWALAITNGRDGHPRRIVRTRARR